MGVRVVDRRHLDADAGPDPTYHFDADPDPYSNQSFTHVRKSEFFYVYSLTASFSSAS
jgi:hypothetical protein